MAAYDAGRLEQAAALFAHSSSLEAKLGAAFAAWPGSVDRVEQLGALYPRSAMVQLHVGIARFWAGRPGAIDAWREAEDVEPDTPYAVRAGDLLNPEFAPGLPILVSGARPAPGSSANLSAAERLEALREGAQDGTLDARLLYGIALQGAGRPLSAREVYVGRRGGLPRRAGGTRRRRGRPVLQGSPGGRVLAPGAAVPAVPALGQRALPPRAAAPLAGRRRAGPQAAEAGSGGRAGLVRRAQGEPLPGRARRGRDRLNERWAERPMALRARGWHHAASSSMSVLRSARSASTVRAPIGGGTG